MTPEEQEELLIRVDERTQAIKTSIDKIIEHQEDQNGYLGAAIADIRSNAVSIKFIKWIGGTIVTASLALAGFFISHFMRG